MQMYPRLFSHKKGRCISTTSLTSGFFFCKLQIVQETLSICCFSGIREFIHNFLIVDLCILCIAGFLIRSGKKIQGISLAVIQFIAFLQIRDRCGIVTALISCISGSIKRLGQRISHRWRTCELCGGSTSGTGVGSGVVENQGHE